MRRLHVLSVNSTRCRPVLPTIIGTFSLVGHSRPWRSKIVSFSYPYHTSVCPAQAFDERMRSAGATHASHCRLSARPN
jgi:hypothetical protein